MAYFSSTRSVELGRQALNLSTLPTFRKMSETAVASSGIAVMLLKKRTTSHTVLKLSLNLQTTENPLSNIAKHSARTKVFVTSKIIITDEYTMAPKRVLKAYLTMWAMSRDVLEAQ